MEARDRVCLVTGGNRGIGREVARQLAQKGMLVFLGSRDLAAGQAAARELSAAASQVATVRLDVCEPASLDRAVQEVAEQAGRLDVLINNAGSIIESAAAETSAAVLREVFETNVFGCAEMIRVALPLLRESSCPRIVNVSSTTGSLALTAAGTDFGGPADQRLAYATSKAALNMLTIQYHRAFQHDPSLRHIKINSATPGYTATGINRHQGTRTVEQGAQIIVRLALLDDSGPSGGFFNDAGPVDW
jgi:NAD(P)-dependent dehydrogenase (short-subunit alcohol dehydrogenase family)